MCLAVHKTCECGTHNIQFHMRDNVLPAEAVTRLFCPSCKGDESYDAATMVTDNGWYIEYDLDLAKAFIARRNLIDPEDVTPAYVFDEGFACWLEMYPGEKEDIKDEKEKIVELLKQDRKQYLQEIQNWNVNRIERLKADGWRKAQFA